MAKMVGELAGMVVAQGEVLASCESEDGRSFVRVCAVRVFPEGSVGDAVDYVQIESREDGTDLGSVLVSCGLAIIPSGGLARYCRAAADDRVSRFFPDGLVDHV